MKNKDYFVRVHSKVLQDPRLKPIDKLLFSIIQNYSEELGYCYASNLHLSKQLGCSVKTVSSTVKKLLGLDLIKVNEGNNVKRTITILPYNLEEITIDQVKVTRLTEKNLPTNIKGEYKNKTENNNTKVNSNSELFEKALSYPIGGIPQHIKYSIQSVIRTADSKETAMFVVRARDKGISIPNSYLTAETVKEIEKLNLEDSTRS